MNAELTVTENQIKDYRLIIGDKIRLIREKRGYSQEQLAELMQINLSLIHISSPLIKLAHETLIPIEFMQSINSIGFQQKLKKSNNEV